MGEVLQELVLYVVRPLMSSRYQGRALGGRARSSLYSIRYNHVNIRKTSITNGSGAFDELKDQSVTYQIPKIRSWEETVNGPTVS
jgi:hypothetical protein